MQDHLALIRRLAVERNAGNNVDILAETKVFKDLLGENRRLPGCNGNADAGGKMLLIEKLEELVKLQTEAIKNIKIDKVTVWDGANGEKSATANFLSGIVKSIPPMQELFDMAGMQLPSYLGTPKAEEAPAAAEVTAE